MLTKSSPAMTQAKLSYGASRLVNQSVNFVIDLADAFEAHKGAVTQLYFEEDNRLLMTGGKDRSLKVNVKWQQIWKLPERWINEEVEKFEESEIKNMKDSMAMIKLQRSMNKHDDDSSDDDLNGWDFR